MLGMITSSPALALFGALVLAYHALTLLNVLFKTWIATGPNPKKYGDWAVVTGSTDGVGKAIAFELARKGCSVLLVSRSEQKLKVVKGEISSKYPSVSVDYAIVDFSKLTPSALDGLKAKLQTIDVGLLVNNVGVSYEFCQWFHELSDTEVANMLSLNVESATWMTRLVLPSMLAKKKGAIVNMSSASARAPLPLLAQYSATKGYLENFTRSLAVEYAGKGIHFQCQSPYFVATAMTFPNSKVAPEKRATMMTPTPQKYAKAAVARIGLDTMTSPYWAHELLLWVQARIPDAVAGPVLLSSHKAVRFHKKNVAKMEEKLKKI
tara:strand:- start:371 stop:1336 length:966 start_codon:yes stop_codon:yes gene_type:complete